LKVGRKSFSNAVFPCSNPLKNTQKAQDESRHLEGWLKPTPAKPPYSRQGTDRAGVRKMIAQLHKEPAVY
jgi:hypothetical protein